jgi:hypothetical protein
MWLITDQINSKQCHFDVPRFSASLMNGIMSLLKKKEPQRRFLVSWECRDFYINLPVLDLHYYLLQMLPVSTCPLMLFTTSCWLLFQCFQIWKNVNLQNFSHGCLWNEARIRYCGHCFFIPLLVRIRDLDTSFLLCLDYTFPCLKATVSL